MTLTVNTLSYEKDTERTPDAIRYNGPSHSFSFKDYIDLKRTAPKVTSTSVGKARSQLKLTRSCTDGTDYVADIILEGNSSIPANCQSSEIVSAHTDMAVFYATAAVLALIQSGDINQ